MAGIDIQITISGRWLTLEALPGDIEMSTIWPGGSEELSWTVGSQTARRYTGGEPVLGYYGGVPFFNGTLVEPDPSQDNLTAQGLWHLGDYFSAFAAGSPSPATTIPDTAIDQAISRGLDWTRPASISSAAATVDISQGPVTVGQLLDMYCDNTALRWGVDPYGQVFTTADPTTPSFQTLPLDGGLGYSLDNYASDLYGRFVNAAGVFGTAARSDANARLLHGQVEAVVDLTSRGPLTSTSAGTILANLLALGRSNPSWTADIEFTYGEILTMGGTAAALETVAAGDLLRVHGGFELAMRQNGAMYIDVMIGQTNLANGTLTVKPFQRATRTYQDFVTESIERRKRLDTPDR